MKPLSLAITALFFYAILNVMIARYFSQIAPLAIIVVDHMVVLIIAIPLFVVQYKLNPSMAMPQGRQYWLLALYGVIIIIADFCYFSAYQAGGSLITMTTIVILVPVFATLIKFFLDGGYPTKVQLLGWVFAAIGVILVSKQ